MSVRLPSLGAEEWLALERTNKDLLAALREGTEWLEAIPVSVLQETDAADVIEEVILHNRAAISKAQTK